jgi:hypothetical protein
MTTRRVPICAINWCCPYRSDLCTSECTGERTPRDNSIIVLGEDVFIVRDDAAHRYHIPEKARETFRSFDRGEPAENLVGDFVFEAPRRWRRHSSA